MSTNPHIYTLEADADIAVWERMNVYLQLYLLDVEGGPIGMASADNRGPVSATPLRAESSVPASRIKVCLYVVPHALPDSRQVSGGPPLIITVRILRNGEVIDTLIRKINPWGGDQLVGAEYGA